MKRLAMTFTALLLATAGAAAAMTSPATLSASDRYEVKRIAPQADLHNLTVEQVVAIESALHNGDDNERGYQIRSILN